MGTGGGSAPAVATAQVRPARGPHGGSQGPVLCPATAVMRAGSSGLSTGDTASGDTVSTKTDTVTVCQYGTLVAELSSNIKLFLFVC